MQSGMEGVARSSLLRPLVSVGRVADGLGVVVRPVGQVWEDILGGGGGCREGDRWTMVGGGGASRGIGREAGLQGDGFGPESCGPSPLV